MAIDEDFESAFQTDEPEPTDSPPSGEPEPDGSPDPLSPQAGTPDEEWIEVGGQRLKPNDPDLENSVRVYNWIKANPEIADRLVEWEQQGYVDYTPPPTPPEEDDPADEFVDPEVKRLRDELEEIRNWVGEREWQSSVSAVDSGVESFRAQHSDLSDGDWSRVLETARDNGLVAAMKNRYGQRPEAVTRALEAAYRIEFYDQAAARSAAATTRDQRNRRRAGQMSASRASVPRQPEPITDPKEGMIADIRDALQG